MDILLTKQFGWTINPCVSGKYATDIVPTGGKLPAPDGIAYRSSSNIEGTGDFDAPNGVSEFLCCNHGPQYAPFVHLDKCTNGHLPENHIPGKCVGMSDSGDYREIASRLEAVRLAFSDLNKKAWAEKHGFQQTQYQHWTKGTRRINLNAAQMLCEQYGLTLDYIYRGRMDGLSDTARNTLLSTDPMASTT